jgi:hypothetical protein
MNIIRKLIHETVALVASIIIGAAICGILFGVSAIFDPNILDQLWYAGIMAFFMIVAVYGAWDKGRPSIIHDIGCIFFYAASLTASSVLLVPVLVVLGNFLDQDISMPSIYSIPPIYVITVIIGFLAFKLRDKSLDGTPPRCGSHISYTPYKPPEVTNHYDKNGNFTGRSEKRK